MRLLVRPLFAIALAAAALSCASDAGSSGNTTAERLNGTWRDILSSPGYHFEMTLATTGNAVTGTGFFSYEAGPIGTVAVTGTVTGDQVDLDIVYSIGGTRHFQGALEMFTLLTGIWYSTPVGDPVPLTLRRTTTPPGIVPL
jgi:hypothetical protein